MKNILPAMAFLLVAPMAQACETFTAGDISVEHAWSRASIGTDRPGVLYLEITNNGTTDDALVSLATIAASMPMLHETVVTDGIASMPHAASVPVPADQTVVLSPGGFHGMLMGLTNVLKEGETFPITLTFEKAGSLDVSVDVLSMRAEAAACDDAK
jgi:periplasmic copper chaperone A